MAGQRPIMKKSCVKTVLMATPSLAPRPDSFSRKYMSR